MPEIEWPPDRYEGGGWTLVVDTQGEERLLDVGVPGGSRAALKIPAGATFAYVLIGEVRWCPTVAKTRAHAAVLSLGCALGDALAGRHKGAPSV